jgi:16S rRNA (guanine527-N7)-methyltransferase
MNTSLFSSHSFDLSPEELAKFEEFLTLFIAYNSHTNLSAIRDEEGIVEKHFVDSLYGADIVMNYEWWAISDQTIKLSNYQTIKLLDIWSGWGFPGIPLKIVMPELHVTLLDSVGKKVKAMNHFVEHLELEDIRAIQSRAEDLAKDPEHKWQYDFVVSRATAYITDILTWALPFLTPTGCIVLYKMPGDEEARDMRRILKKMKLTLEWELEYELAEKKRVIYVIKFAK